MTKLCWFALALALCGCRQQETASGAPPAAEAPKPAAPPVDARPEIACFGDSLTAGQGLEPEQSFPALLQRELDREGYRYRVANFGVGGDTTQDGLERLPLVLADKPALVVLELGANDGLRGQPVAVTEDNLGQIVRALQQGGAQVLLAGITLPPNYGPAYIGKFQAMYPELAAKYKIPLIPFLLAGVGGNSRLMQRDGLHPNAEGTGVVAHTVLQSLKPLIKK
ncbi:MAG: arylesterase [Candidatus Sulfopaludibacter sp.]|nr:arylesterase [Candidatus Sulfopaludibacter sp.]